MHLKSNLFEFSGEGLGRIMGEFFETIKEKFLMKSLKEFLQEFQFPTEISVRFPGEFSEGIPESLKKFQDESLK